MKSMNFTGRFALAAALPLAACAPITRADLPVMKDRPDVISAASVLASTICEAEEAAKFLAQEMEDESLKSLEIGTVFTLEVSETDTGGASLGLTSLSNVTTVKLTGTSTPKAVGKRTMKFDQAFATGTEPQCSTTDFEERGLTRIASGLGIQDAIQQWAELGAVVEGAPNKQLSYTAKFDVTNTVGLSGSVSEANPSGNTYTFGFTPSKARTASHSVTLTITKRPSGVGAKAAIPADRQEKLIEEAERFLELVTE